MSWLIVIIMFVIFFFFLLIHAGKKANKTDWDDPILNILEGINRIFCNRYHRLNQVTIPLAQSGPSIVVSNHISGLDPMLMIASSPRPLRFLIAREQYERFGLQWLFKAVGCIPIDRSKQADNSMRQAIKALEAGEVLAIFPHGKIHLPDDVPVKMKPGAARLALKIGCPIVPTFISGIRAPGHVLTPVVLRADAHIMPCEPIDVTNIDILEINDLIASCIG